MKATTADISWEQLARYIAGECDAVEAAELSRRIENEPAVAAAMAEMLLQAVLIRDNAEAHPERRATATTPMARWRGRRVLGAIAAAIALLLAGWWILEQRPEPAILRITQTSGSVRWTGSGGEVREWIQNGAALPGGLFETLGDDSSLELAFTDGTALTLLGHSTAAISEKGQKIVHLRSGRLSAEVRPQPQDQPLCIHTPTALLEVLGTRFEVDSDDSATRLAVNEGRVRLTRRVDGRTAEVLAQHEAIASVKDRDMVVAPRKEPQVLWRSDFASGPAGTSGVWLPATQDKAPRLAAEVVFLPKSGLGPVTIYRVGVSLPWKDRSRVHVTPGSHLRLRGRAESSATLEVMLACMKPTGGYAGNWFQKRSVAAGAWQLDLSVSEFRHWHAAAKTRVTQALELRQIAIYTIAQDAGIEIESVEVLGD
jgi:ferric-dicitrate binding protein FerR (iron transport regulator)